MGEENDKTQCACVCGSLVGRMLASGRGVVWLVGRLGGGGGGRGGQGGGLISWLAGGAQGGGEGVRRVKGWTGKGVLLLCCCQSIW